MSKCFNGLLLGANIIVARKRIHICKQNNIEVFSLTNKGLTLSHLFALILESFLSIFLTPQIRGEVKITKQLISLDDNNGKLTFNWETHVTCE